MTITGPSCSGKSSLEQALCEGFPLMFQKLVSVTTRAPRPGEVEGSHYHFVNRDEFAELLNSGRLAQFVKFGDHFYGTLSSEADSIMKSGMVPVVVVEPTGVDQYRDWAGERGASVFALYVMGDPFELAERWIDRVQAEGDMTADRKKAIAERLANTYVIEGSDWPGATEYSLVLKRFGADCERRVMEKLADITSQLKDKTKLILPQAQP